MFEITLSSENSKHISYLTTKIREKLKTIKSIMVCEDFDGRENLAIATNEKNKDLALSYIFDAVSEALIRSYKEEILLSSLNNKIQDKVILATFVKALTMYDKVSDKEFIMSKLNPSKFINIDSFYYFKLWDLKYRWEHIAELLNENSSYLMMSGAFDDLMRFLINTNDVEFSDIYLHIENDKVIAKTKDGVNVFCLEYNNDDNFKVKIVSELISLSPNKIILSKDFYGLEITNYLKFLYDGKICVLK